MCVLLRNYNCFTFPVLFHDTIIYLPGHSLVLLEKFLEFFLIFLIRALRAYDPIIYPFGHSLVLFEKFSELF
jgi:hypothetical protein